MVLIQMIQVVYGYLSILGTLPQPFVYFVSYCTFSNLQHPSAFSTFSLFKALVEEIVIFLDMPMARNKLQNFGVNDHFTFQAEFVELVK
jgi:hypothetical protein